MKKEVRATITVPAELKDELHAHMAEFRDELAKEVEVIADVPAELEGALHRHLIRFSEKFYCGSWTIAPKAA